MSNNGRTNGNTPIEIAVQAYRKVLEQSVNQGMPRDVSVGLPIRSVGTSLASFRPIDGLVVVSTSAVSPFSYGYIAFLNNIPINPSDSALYSIVNNSDSILYIAPDSGSANSIVRSPSIIIPPYYRASVGMSLQSFLSAVSYVPHFDYTNGRSSNLGEANADPDSLVTQRISVYSGLPSEAGIMVPIKRNYSRVYEEVDFTTDFGAAPIVLNAGTPSYSSSAMNFDGFKDIAILINVSALNATNIIVQLNTIAFNAAGYALLTAASSTISAIGTTVISAGVVRSRLWMVNLTATTPTGNSTISLQVGGVAQ